MNDRALIDRAAKKARLKKQIEELEELIDELDRQSLKAREELLRQRVRLNEIKTEFANLDPPLN